VKVQYNGIATSKKRHGKTKLILFKVKPSNSLRRNLLHKNVQIGPNVQFHLYSVFSFLSEVSGEFTGAQFQRHNEGYKGEQFPGLNHSGSAESLRGAPKRPNSTFTSGWPQLPTWGRQTCFLLRAPSTSSRTCPVTLVCAMSHEAAFAMDVALEESR